VVLEVCHCCVKSQITGSSSSEGSNSDNDCSASETSCAQSYRGVYSASGGTAVAAVTIMLKSLVLESLQSQYASVVCLRMSDCATAAQSPTLSVF
jgi:hypothetical protein